MTKIPPPNYENPVPWEAISGLTADDLNRLARSVQRVRILVSNKVLAEEIGKAWHNNPDGFRTSIEGRAA